jgi:hypothetical protein
MKRLVTAVISVAVLLGGCDLLSKKPGADGKGGTAIPVTKLDFAASGVTSNAGKEISAAGMTVTDSNPSDHQTAFWSLSDIQVNKAYTFSLKVKKDAASKVASLIQVDMQSGTEKTSFECPFQLYDGQAAGRKAAEGGAVKMTDSGESYIVTCPTQSGPATDAIYAYIFPAVGPANGSYESTAVGSIVVEEVSYTVGPIVAAPAPAPAAPAATAPAATAPAATAPAATAPTAPAATKPAAVEKAAAAVPATK